MQFDDSSKRHNRVFFNGEDTRTRMLDFIRYRSKMGMLPPSVREIGEAVGLSSSSTVHSHLNQLERKRLIVRERSKSRAIEVVRKPEEICSCCNGSGWAQPFSKVLPGTELIGDNRPPEETSFGH